MQTVGKQKEDLDLSFKFTESFLISPTFMQQLLKMTFSCCSSSAFSLIDTPLEIGNVLKAYRVWEHSNLNIKSAMHVESMLAFLIFALSKIIIVFFLGQRSYLPNSLYQPGNFNCGSSF